MSVQHQHMRLMWRLIDESFRYWKWKTHADIVTDLRVHNGCRKAVFDPFWSACKQVLEEKLGLVVDNCGHDDVQHMASVVSILDLWQQAESLCQSIL